MPAQNHVCTSLYCSGQYEQIVNSLTLNLVGNVTPLDLWMTFFSSPYQNIPRYQSIYNVWSLVANEYNLSYMEQFKHFGTPNWPHVTPIGERSNYPKVWQDNSGVHKLPIPQFRQQHNKIT